jgi:hypothetical protein
VGLARSARDRSRSEAAGLGLANVTFEVADAPRLLQVTDPFGLKRPTAAG